MPTSEDIFDAECLSDLTLAECRTKSIFREWDEVGDFPSESDFEPIGTRVKVLIFENRYPQHRHVVPACVVIDSKDKSYFATSQPWDMFAQALLQA